MEFITQKVNDVAVIQGCYWTDLQRAAAKFQRSRITVESFSEKAEISLQQIRWFKGVLLIALSADTGDTARAWEARLKLNVMPEEFQPETCVINDAEYAYLPSIKTLSITKTNQFIEGAVEYLHGIGFDWVQLPDSSLKK